MSNQNKYSDTYDKFFMTKIVIEECIGNIAIFKAMNDILVDVNNYILIHQMNNSAFLASIRFCNIFGTYSENNHWKKFFEEESINNQIINEVILKVFGSISKWECYHKIIKEFRDDYVVHHQINPFGDKILVPDFEIAFELLKKYYYFIVEKIYAISENRIINNFDSMYKKAYEDTIELYKNFN